MKHLFHSALDLAGNVVETAITLPRVVRERVEGRELWTSETPEVDAPAEAPKAKAAATTAQKATTEAAETAAATPEVEIPAAAKEAVPSPVAAADETAAIERGEDVTPAPSTGLAARLEAINGIGPAKRRAILDVYDDEATLAKVDVATLSSIDGISERLAKLVLDAVNG